MIYQLRIYEIFAHNKSAPHTRFRDHAARSMRRCAKTEHRTEFAYLLAWPDTTATHAAWAEFMADEEWKEITRVMKAEQGHLVGAIEDRLLVPTDYSPSLLR